MRRPKAKFYVGQVVRIKEMGQRRQYWQILRRRYRKRPNDSQWEYCWMVWGIGELPCWLWEEDLCAQNKRERGKV